jgi:Zn-dependent M28 family amino/carboxypeptidase
VKRTIVVVVAVCTPLFCAARRARAQQGPSPDARLAAAVRADAIWAPLRFLSDDLLEGRGTGRRGGALAAQYLAAQFMALGLEPAGDGGTWFQQVPIASLQPSPAVTFVEGGTLREMRYRDDFVAWSERVDTLVHDSGDVVFVGYGITAPEWRWDDYKGVDLRGKILLMLVNDPGLRDASLFRGRTLTYYGRWTYKLEEAARHGATGVLLIHDDTMATYGWSTVVNSWTGPQVRLESPPTSLKFAGWLTGPTARELLASRGLDLERLMAAAEHRDFQPLSTGVEAVVTIRSSLRRLTTANVVGRLPGRDPGLGKQVVVISAHYDHLGIGAAVDGDSIMNGAVDNASGVATMLGVGDALARTGLRPRRSLLFVGMAAEESGLLGSAWMANHPPVSPAAVAADLNVDGVNLFGRTRDISALGLDQSSLGRVFRRAAAAERLRVIVDSVALARGGFFRSDHFSYARAGIPSLSWEGGHDFVGRPAGWGREQDRIYERDRYHQPADNLLPWYNVDGALQEARVLARVAWAVGEAADQPSWDPRSEFAAAGRERAAR